MMMKDEDYRALCAGSFSGHLTSIEFLHNTRRCLSGSAPAGVWVQHVKSRRNASTAQAAKLWLDHLSTAQQ